MGTSDSTSALHAATSGQNTTICCSSSAAVSIARMLSSDSSLQCQHAHSSNDVVHLWSCFLGYASMLACCAATKNERGLRF